MTWREIVAESARRAQVSQADGARVLEAFQEVVSERLVAGEAVRMPSVGTLATAWRKTRAVRSISDLRKIVLDGRFVVRFRPARGLREAVAARTPQLWRDPRQQAAWRVAETLLGDLALYHAAKKPSTLPPEVPQARALLEASFGDAWVQARRLYESKVDPPVRAACDHLVEAAIVRWA